MNVESIKVESTLAIILGASEWPDYAPEPDATSSRSRSFAASANDFRDYLLSSKFSLPRSNILYLFDSAESPGALLADIGNFLKDREIKDIIIYYVGHGGFEGERFYLTIKDTKEICLGSSSISCDALANVLDEITPFSRHYIILDCCFAATAVKYFQSQNIADLAFKQLEDLNKPSRGRALLCSASKNNPSLAPKDLQYTMFSGALLKVLRDGDGSNKERLSFKDIKILIERILRRDFTNKAVRPEIHTPKQEEGDIAELGFFPNSSYEHSSSYGKLMQRISNESEVSIRREYSDFYPSLKALGIWVGNTFSEICFHKELVYDYKLRIKPIKSLIRKLESLSNDGHEIKFLEDAKELVEDFVGIRVMVFVQNEILTIDALLNKMHRIDIKKVTIHYPERLSRSLIIDNIYQSNSEICVKEPNKRGYFGIHYTIAAKFEDEYYLDAKIKPFDKYELQVCTVIQHLWSELHRKLIYMPHTETALSRNVDVMMPQFELLADQLNHCDSLLERLCEPIQPAPTKKIQQSEMPVTLKQKRLIETIQNEISNWEEKKVSANKRAAKAKFLIEKYAQDIEKATSNVTEEEAVALNSQIAELYLKSGHHEDAYNLYKNILKIQLKNPWLYLRLAETCHSMAKDEETKVHLIAIEKLTKEEEGQKLSDEPLYTGAGMLAWELNYLEMAVYFGGLAIQCIPKGERIIRTRLNLIYYQTEYWVEKYLNYPERLEIKLEGIRDEVKSVNKDQKGFTASKYHTVAYYYYALADAKNRNHKNTEAREDIELADDAIKKCFSEWMANEQEKQVFHERWATHANMIKALKEGMEN